MKKNTTPSMIASFAAIFIGIPGCNPAFFTGKFCPFSLPPPVDFNSKYNSITFPAYVSDPGVYLP